MGLSTVVCRGSEGGTRALPSQFLEIIVKSLIFTIGAPSQKFIAVSSNYKPPFFINFMPMHDACTLYKRDFCIDYSSKCNEHLLFE